MAEKSQTHATAFGHQGLALGDMQGVAENGLTPQNFLELRPRQRMVPRSSLQLTSWNYIAGSQK